MSCLEAYQQLGVASQSDLDVLASCHEYDSIMVKHLFLPLMFPLLSITTSLQLPCSHQLSRQSSRPNLHKTASSIFLIELLTGVYLISHANNHHASSGPSTLNDNGN
ncbi:hypothetical protein PENPOL_c001G08912 [Penicillium polonicum]|uniref:Uncharacterized protein n=1 Tax=Penicillium polonicum TaxID=60169 RepID=A0A1V6P4A5_PENPO|nr:hypothetical protein PENPOL_c001G08912 [Penicillium polonicum]